MENNMPENKEQKEARLLVDILLDIGDRILSIENAMHKQKEVMIKLVKQGNTIVRFLNDLNIEDVTTEYSDISFEPDNMDETTFHSIKELLDDYMEKTKGLKELEKELEKNKDKITVGQHGES
jgi:hypothetical protein|tara:strand:- start:64 stop:432 length:369 start_codon:yes stop_codon:yes gene_type:complete